MFGHPADYDSAVDAGDLVEVLGLWKMLSAGGKGDVRLRVRKRGGGERRVEVGCSLSPDQARFILAGSALNLLAGKGGGKGG